MSEAGEVCLWTGKRILVAGDVMLDHFVYGTVGRVSPEAPVPVLWKERERRMLGGAGNVARNVVAMGGAATLVGFRGQDAAGAELADLCAQIGVRDRVLPVARPTTQKVRFIAQSQQLLRVDHEETAEFPREEGKIAAAVRQELADADILVVSDYAKGVLTESVLRTVIGEARARGVATIVDPKQQNLRIYAGATVLTPNAKETAAATGINPRDNCAAEEAGRAVLATCGVEAVLITRGAQGMTLVTGSGTWHFNSSAREVFDVSGAGDTVVASLALGLAAGQDLMTSAHVANIAAGLVVSKAGTATAGRQEVLAALETHQGGRLGHGTSTLEEAIGIVQRWRSSGLRVGFANGCFDLVHSGHIHLLAQARAACDRLVVGLNSDDSVRRLKGPARPLQSAGSRTEILNAMRMVDLVVVFDEDTPLNAILALRPDVLVKGADYAGKHVVGREEVESWGGRVILVDLKGGQSTTGISQGISGVAALARVGGSKE